MPTKKPNRKSRKNIDSDNVNVDNSKTIDNNTNNNNNTNNTKHDIKHYTKHNTDNAKNQFLKAQLRDRIKQMQKDRAKGSYVCEENANHEY